MSGKQTAELIAVLKDNWQAETKGYHTYQTLSEAETGPRRRNALRGLAAAERHHADLWSKRLKELDGSTLVYGGKQTEDAETLSRQGMRRRLLASWAGETLQSEA